MKKTILWLLMCIVLGVSMGFFLYSKYDTKETELVSAEVIKNENIYVLQVGVYSNKDNFKNIKINHVYEYLNDKYYVYVAMTRNKENLDKLKKYFKNQNYEVYVKEIEVNGEYALTLKQYDLLLDEALSDESIKTILETSLAKFEEIALNDKNQRITT